MLPYLFSSISRLIVALQLFSLVEFKALILAILIHGRQKRKYTGEPYWFHLLNVAMEVKKKGYQSELVVAALFHDTLEDPLLEITDRCGYLVKILDRLKGIDREHVLELVVDLTDVYIKRDFPHLKRKERKELEVKRMESVSFHSKIIKLADICDNSADIAVQDANFFKVYQRECLELTHAMGNVDKSLYNSALASLK